MVDLTKLAFYSLMNYMKRSEFVGSASLTLGGAGAVSTHTVNHNLGYVPFFIVGANLNNTTTIWSGTRVHYATQSSAFADQDIELEYWCTTTDLTIRIRNGDGSFAQAGSRTVYWVIYLDYQ